MKRAIILLFTTLFSLIFGVSLWADEKNPLYENIVIETFDGAQASQYPKASMGRVVAEDGSVQKLQNAGQDIVWRVGKELASRFVTEGFPTSRYVDSWPIDLYGVSPEQEETLKVFGVRTKFNRQGYNFFALYVGREVEGEWIAQGLPLSHDRDRQGVIKNVSVWVWGAGFNYTIEAHVRDYTGVAHVLPLSVVSGIDHDRYKSGSLAFKGWRKMATAVSSSIPQALGRYNLIDRRLQFVKFVVRTAPYERVDDFYIYFDQMEATIDFPAVNFYDGRSLSQPAEISKIWGEGEISDSISSVGTE